MSITETKPFNSPGKAAPSRSSRLCVVMLVANQFRNDTRVYKEARSLIEWGCDVHVLAMSAKDLPATETQEEIRVARLPMPPPIRSAGACRQG